MAEDNKSGLEVFESSENLQTEFNKAEGFIKKNSKLMTYIGGGILAIAAAVVAYNYYTKTQDTEAQTALFPAVYAFETDSLAKALKGGAATAGLTTIADDYSGTDAGNLASFYAGVALLKQGKYDDAIERLGNFNSSDLLVQARAYSLIGDAYMEKKNAADAVKFYQKAVDYKENAAFTPVYMLKLATAHEVAKDNAAALEVYTKILEKYPNAQEAGMAKRFKAKLEGVVGE
jgi:predicted negative regulator of RcsB-dependent stress response